MIRFLLKQRIADKEFRDQRRITLEEIAQQTGLGRNTLSRILNTHGHSTSTENLDKLCAYFGCKIGELVEYVPDK